MLSSPLHVIKAELTAICVILRNGDDVTSPRLRAERAADWLGHFAPCLTLEIANEAKLVATRCSRGCDMSL